MRHLKEVGLYCNQNRCNIPQSEEPQPDQFADKVIYIIVLYMPDITPQQPALNCNKLAAKAIDNMLWSQNTTN